MKTSGGKGRGPSEHSLNQENADKKKLVNEKFKYCVFGKAMFIILQSAAN
jgi:hypothetical protein